MSWALVASAQATPGTVSPITISHSGIAGRLYTVIAGRNVANEYFTGVTDNGGNTWTKLEDTPDSGTVGRRTEFWYCVPTNAFTTISLAFAGSNQAQASMYAWTGQDNADLVEASASNFRSASTTPAVVECTPNETDCLVIAGIQANNNNHSTGIAASGGWTSLPTNGFGPAVAYQLNPTSGVALGCSWTLTNSVGSGHVIGAFNMAEVVDPPPTEAGVTVWDGAEELEVASITVWDGADEVPATFDTVTS